MIKEFKYFVYGEFECPCCARNATSKKFIGKLDYAREKARVPFVVTSGYRCKRRNLKEKGTLTSVHLVGLAADISTPTAGLRYHVLKGLFAAGFVRMGIGKDFIHVDDGYANKTNEVVWDYYAQEREFRARSLKL